MALSEKEKNTETDVLYFLKEWFWKMCEISCETWETMGNLTYKLTAKFIHIP